MANAADIAARYEAHLIRNEWRAAWDMLAPDEQIHRGSYSAFVYDRSALDWLTSPYTLRPPVHDEETIAGWASPVTAKAVLSRAYIVEIDYATPATSMAGNASYEVLLVAPDTAGQWWVWQVR